MEIRIMVVDDSKFIEEDIRLQLAGTDFQVCCYCRDGEAAVAAYPQVKPDIVIMDIIMPGMDGFEAAKKILQEDPGAGIIILSSLAYDDTIRQARELGITEFLFKPIDKERLLESLARISLSRLDQERGK